MHATVSLSRPWLLLWSVCLAVLLLASGTRALAQDDPPGRVGRLANLNGGVSWLDAEQGQWAPAERNRPLTGGDRISTARDGRAELRIGSTTVRLANGSDLELLQLDDARITLQLHSGSLALHVRTREVADEIEVRTTEARLLPLREGLYRVDRSGDSTLAGAWRGELRVDGPQGLVVAAGQRLDLLRSDRPGALPVWSNMPNDGFTAWVLAEDASEARAATAAYVSPEMTGAEDLDRNGRWEQHPEFGAVWMPLQVQPDWAPYRYGHWAWVRPWGWTWVDDAPWGFAPFHYGRWAFWRERWCWVPGAYVARPVFAPALVGWVGAGGGGGGPGWSLSLRVGGPPVGWVPLAPREVYQPAYRSTPAYLRRMHPVADRWQHPPGQRPPAAVFWANQGARHGVNLVAPEVLMRRQPVARALIDPAAASRSRWRDSPAPEGPRGEGPDRPDRQDRRAVPRPDWRPGAAAGGPTDEGRLVRPDRLRSTDRLDGAERGDRVDRPERPERPDGHDRPGAFDRREPMPLPSPSPSPSTLPGAGTGTAQPPGSSPQPMVAHPAGPGMEAPPAQGAARERRPPNAAWPMTNGLPPASGARETPAQAGAREPWLRPGPTTQQQQQQPQPSVAEDRGRPLPAGPADATSPQRQGQRWRSGERGAAEGDRFRGGRERQPPGDVNSSDRGAATPVQGPTPRSALPAPPAAPVPAPTAAPTAAQPVPAPPPAAAPQQRAAERPREPHEGRADGQQRPRRADQPARGKEAEGGR